MARLLRMRGGLVGAALLTACGSSGSGPVDPGADAANVVELRTVSFNPSTINIPVGATARWINQAAILHTVTPQGHGEWQAVVLSRSGDSFEHTFTQAGTFEYYCAQHVAEGMTGVIRVGAGGEPENGGDDDEDDDYDGGY